MHWFQLRLAKHECNLPGEVIYADGAAAGNVVDSTPIQVSFKALHVCFNYILDEGKISRLLTIAKDGWRIVVDNFLDKRRNHPAVGTIFLPGLVDVEVPEGNCIQSIHFEKSLAVILRSELRDPVGRYGRRVETLHLRKNFSVSVHRRRRCVNKLLDFRVHRSLEEVHGSTDIDSIGELRILHRSANTDNCGFVYHNIVITDYFLNKLKVRNVSNMKFDSSFGMLIL